jgi:phosphate transport system substrate-binding protein
LKQRFEEKFPGTTVELAAAGTDQAIESLLNDQIELAAVGRSLTDEEKAQGLTEVPIIREKIAIVVGPNNPFTASLTFDQFAKIFRGEVTDWAQVGGQPGPIRLIDRPDFSDTRRALSQYEVFKTAPFASGPNATQIDQDDTTAVVEQLGSDGIGYAIASQVLNQDNVKVLAMHDTLPDDPRYPFSQPRGYVYKGELSPGAQAFLGFATSAPGQEIVEEAKAAEAQAVATASPDSPASSTVEASPSPAEASPSPVIAAAPAPAGIAFDPSRLWWLLLPLIGLPLLLAWLAGRGGILPVAAKGRSRLILTPRNCRDAFAYW